MAQRNQKQIQIIKIKVGSCIRLFSYAWEQRELGEIAEINPKTTIPDQFKYVDLESVIGTELIQYRFISKSKAPSRAQRLARKGDLFYQTVRPYQKNNCLFESHESNFVFSSGYAQIRSDIDGQFLLSVVQSNKFVETVLSRSTGTSYPAISPKELAKIQILIPKNYSEANLIGELLKTINKTITLHQRE